MRLAALCSGGKDSAYAMWLAMGDGHEISQMVAMIPERPDSWMFHRPNTHLVDLFAKCAELPLVKAKTSGVREAELGDLKKALSGIEVDGVVSGAIASTYQKSRIERICDELGLVSVTPLWGREPVELLEKMLEDGIRAIITSVSAEGLDEKWLGREIDRGCVRDLTELRDRFGVDPAGEGGEYETLVLDAPFFSKRIEILKAEKVWEVDSGYIIVERAEAKDK